MVACEERQFDLLTLKDDEEIQAFRENGLYVFRFFKGGAPVFVVIDDLIPTFELADGRPVPLFARCSNQNLFWVSLIEKAFAKLHGRYFSLQGGTTDEALEDLLGVSVENCFIDHDMTDPAALTVTLQTLCQNHCIVGMKIDVEMFAANKQDQFAKNSSEVGLSEADRQKIYKKAESKGLLPFHMYSVLDVRVIQNAQNKQVTLIRL